MLVVAGVMRLAISSRCIAGRCVLKKMFLLKTFIGMRITTISKTPIVGILSNVSESTQRKTGV